MEIKGKHLIIERFGRLIGVYLVKNACGPEQLCTFWALPTL